MAKMVTDLNVIKSDCDTAPDGADWRGEFVQFGKLQKKVFYETEELSELRPIMDPHTNGPMYKRGAGGVTLNSVMKMRVSTGSREREFIQVDQGNGIVVKQYRFRREAGEVEADARRDRKSKFVDELFEKSERAGGLDALLSDEDEDAEEEYPQSYAPGRWLLSDGTKIQGSRAVAEIAEKRLQTTPAA